MASLKGKRVLITGATGFVGSNLVRMALKEGSDVHIITRTKSDKWRIDDVSTYITDYNSDLLDYKRLDDIVSIIRPDIIYHTATYGGKPNQRETIRIVQTNLIGTINLIKACMKFSFDLFVNTGSSSEYGIKEKPMMEEDLLEPVNDYGVSKSAATQYCRAIAKTEELPIVTLRLFSPYGSYEGSTRLIPSVILSCLRRNKPIISSPNFVRDFVHIKDVLDAYEKLIDIPQLSGEILNIGSGKQCTIEEVANKIIELLGNCVELETGMAQRWPNEPKKWEADISKANDILAWKPKYDLENGLAETISWFEKNINRYNNCLGEL
jgi:nucleoside-diphosphate-sugar epimerase